MKTTLLKRVVSLSLAACMILPIMACGSNSDSNSQTQTQTQTSQTPTDGKAFAEPTKVKVAIPSSASWPYNSNWKMWQYFREGSGADIEVQSIPDSDFDTKVSLMMSSPELLPDLFYMFVKPNIDSYASSGVFVSLDENYDKLPNMKKFLDSLPEAERKDLVAQRTSGDGKMYSAPCYGTQTCDNLRSWIYRKDVFEQNNIAVPTTMEEVYQAAKKLKKLYPKSYPVCLRDGLSTMDVFVSGWAPYLSLNSYYDFTDKTWKYGPTQPAMRDVAEYFLKLYKEGLVSPDYMTINTKSWEELMSTDRGFMSFEYIVRIDFFNKVNRKDNPKYTWATMAPPKPDSPTGQSKITKTNYNFSGYLVCNTGKEDRINNAMKLLDWMYSDKGTELLSWGKKGETYEEKDGRRQFILPTPEDNPMTLYGVGTSGILQHITTDSFEASYSKEQVEECHKALQHINDNACPVLWLPLNKEETDQASQLRLEIGTYFEEHFSKILMGQEPISNWDNMVKDMNGMGVDKLLNIYKGAYDRVMSKK